jgi:hypothetical protein
MDTMQAESVGQQQLPSIQMKAGAGKSKGSRMEGVASTL